MFKTEIKIRIQDWNNCTFCGKDRVGSADGQGVVVGAVGEEPGGQATQM